MDKPKTHIQLQRIFGLAKRLDITKDDLEALAAEVTGGRCERLSLLSFEQANAVITRLGGDAVADLSPVPARTLRYRRKKAGVVQIAGSSQIALIDDLAAKRNISADGLERLCRRMLKGSPRPRTSIDANKIIEALKAMIARDADTARRVA